MGRNTCLGNWMSIGLCSRIFTMVGFPGLNSDN